MSYLHKAASITLMVLPRITTLKSFFEVGRDAFQKNKSNIKALSTKSREQ
jgi:hypothetical protein